MRSPVFSRPSRGAVRWRRRGERQAPTSLPVAVLLSGLFAIVFFLLHLFWASGETTPPRRVAGLPRARNVLDLTTAPIVAVTGGQLYINEHPLGSTRTIEDGGRVVPRIDELFYALKTIKDDWRKINGDMSRFSGVVNLEIGGDVPAMVVVSIYRTCALAGFVNVSLMVERK